jgi:hypothetical protein
MPYDCEPAQEVHRRWRHPVHTGRDQGGRYVRAFIIILTFAIASVSGTSVVAQEGHPLKGSWVGEWGPSKLHSDDLLMILNWDGKAITGMVNPGTDNIAIKSATLTPPPAAPGDWVVRLQFDAKDPSGAAVAYTLEGKIENLAFHNRTISGTWKSARESGKFKVQRQ